MATEGMGEEGRGQQGEENIINILNNHKEKTIKQKNILFFLII